MLNQYEKKVFQNCTVKASDFSFSNSSRKDTVNVNCSKDTPTVMNPSFPRGYYCLFSEQDLAVAQ